MRKVIDQAGVFRNSYSYKAFGELRALSENVSNPYRFTGRRWLAGQEEYYFRARFMAPGLGRFTSPDVYSPMYQPTYTYALGNPTSFVDPEGEFVASAAVFGLTAYELYVLGGATAISVGIIAKNQQDPDYFPRKIQAVGETIGKMCRSTWEAIKLYRRLKYAYETIEFVYETGSRYVQEMAQHGKNRIKTDHEARNKTEQKTKDKDAGEANTNKDQARKWKHRKKMSPKQRRKEIKKDRRLKKLKKNK